MWWFGNRLFTFQTYKSGTCSQSLLKLIVFIIINVCRRKTSKTFWGHITPLQCNYNTHEKTPAAPKRCQIVWKVDWPFLWRVDRLYPMLTFNMILLCWEMYLLIHYSSIPVIQTIFTNSGGVAKSASCKKCFEDCWQPPVVSGLPLTSVLPDFWAEFHLFLVAQATLDLAGLVNVTVSTYHLSISWL